MTLTIPAEPVDPKVMLPVLREMTQSIVDAMVGQAAEQGQAVSCRAGCAACCRQLIPISEVEARQLAALVSGMPDARQEEIRGRFFEAVRRLEELDLIEPLRSPDRRGDWSLREVGLAFLRARIDCPFLEDETCSIYQDRPLSCREFLVTSPAENCWNPTAETVRQVPMPAKVSNALISLNKGSGAEARSFVPLVLALEWVSRNPDGMPEISGPDMLKQIVEALSGKTIKE